MEFLSVVFILVCSFDRIVSAIPDYTVILLPGNTIVPPKEYPSPSGIFKLTLNNKKLAVVRACDGVEVWNTHPHTSFITKLTLKEDGDLWLYGDPVAKTNEVLWETGTNGSRFVNPRLTLSDDGIVRLYSGDRCYWESAKVTEEKRCPIAASGDDIKQTTLLNSGQSLQAGLPYYSPSRTYKLQLQIDGNLVVYRECDEMAVFSAYTYQATVTNATLHPDGNFAVHGSMGFKWYGPIWFAEPWKGDAPEMMRMSGSELRLSNDGYLYQCKGTNCFWRSGYFHDMIDSPCTPARRVQLPEKLAVTSSSRTARASVALFSALMLIV